MTARPVAHRGLHDAAAGIIENTASAVDAAVAGGYAIEVDVQLSRDGEAMVFHDFALERLTTGCGKVADLSVAELQALAFKGTADAMMTLPELLARVDGRTLLLVEIKSAFTGDVRLARRTAELAAAYAGPIALMSFDPEMVAAVAEAAPKVRRGIVAQRRYGDSEWTGLSALQRWTMGHLLHWPRSHFQFIAYRVADLGAPVLRLARACGMPVLTWTVRSPQDRARCASGADQMIFETFRP
ncbi:glycerophosphodiester phosphodiesterase family protein [Azorhizobium sp. AG788]|uniref:glycerophosphodiester phosphodiesterase family protein n=1 Tax=Azorhizobium sp. AG788 TaxID=2183897 RepID=UPI0031389658